MNILAVDTALGACSTAVLAGEAVLARCFEPMDRGHAERLAPMVRETMKRASLRFGALERLAVTVGPGTFTGQRVGYAFMRALRLALKRPLIGVTTLEAMALAATAKTGARSGAVLHDARRGEVYFIVVVEGQAIVPVQMASLAEAVHKVWEAVGRIDGPLALAGTAENAAAELLSTRGADIAKTGIGAPDALWVARMALSAAEPDAVPPPLYLRPPDARPPVSRPEIRVGALGDLPAIAAIHGQCFAEAWDTGFLGRLFAQRGAFAAVAIEDRRVAGFILARANAGEAEILSLGVRPSSRRRSLATKLVRDALERAAEAGAIEVFLEVAVDNAPARALYGSLGFREAGYRPAYYGRGADALILRRALTL